MRQRFIQTENELVDHFTSSGGGWWPALGDRFTPRTTGGEDHERGMYSVLDDHAKASERKKYRSVVATLALVDVWTAQLLAIAYTPRPLGNGAFQAALMVRAARAPSPLAGRLEGADFAAGSVLSPLERPIAQLAPYTDAAREGFTAWRAIHGTGVADDFTLDELVAWLDDEARGPRAEQTFRPIREHATTMRDGALAAYELVRVSRSSTSNEGRKREPMASRQSRAAFRAALAGAAAEP